MVSMAASANRRRVTARRWILGLAGAGLALAAATTAASANGAGWPKYLHDNGGSGYAADGGLQKTLGNWPSVSVKALNSGDSLNLGWQTQTNGSSYRAVIHRVDNGGTQTYAVVVYGRSPGRLGGQAAVTQMVAGNPGDRKSVV